MKTYSVIGLMSGTSLDGLDVAWCEFRMENGKWHYKIIEAETCTYDNKWRKTLSQLHRMSAKTFTKTDVMFARLMAGYVNSFIEKHGCRANLIASHGQTIFHNPPERYTTQIGNGAVLAALTGKNVVSDFRSADVALGGQGAPLVPIGDRMLFGEYDYCVNLGGFANISFEVSLRRIAFDVCPANFIINKLYSEAINEGTGANVFDSGGAYAKQGLFIEELFEKLNSLEYYKLYYPKSLGREWLESVFLPVICDLPYNKRDILNTVYHHIAFQIASVINNRPGSKALFTGGGAHNDYMMLLIKKYTPEKEVIIPDHKTIDYKEALVFAFLGLLRTQGKINCLKSVTGAKRNSSAGAIYKGKL